MRRTFLLAWPLDRRAGTSRQPLRERTGGRGAIRGSLPTRRDARIPQSPSQAPVTAPFRQGGHCGLLKRRPVCAGRRGRHPSSAGHPQDDMAGSGTIRGIAPYGRGKDGRPHPALRATCPPCGARKTVRAYADPPVFRPLRKKSPRFFCRRQREGSFPRARGRLEGGLPSSRRRCSDTNGRSDQGIAPCAKAGSGGMLHTTFK